MHFEDLRKISHVLISEHQILCPFRNHFQIVKRGIAVSAQICLKSSLKEKTIPFLDCVAQFKSRGETKLLSFPVFLLVILKCSYVLSPLPCLPIPKW